MVFMKLPSAVVPPTGPIVCPPVVKRLDYEGELGVVIGAGGVIAGYTVCNDVSARDLQRRERQWTRAKGFDTSCPGTGSVDHDGRRGPGPAEPAPAHMGQRRPAPGRIDQRSALRLDHLVDFLPRPARWRRRPDPDRNAEWRRAAMDPRGFLESGDVIRIEIESLGSIEHAVR